MGVALTFDDGPHPRWTPRVLDALDREAAAATFFVQGASVVRWPQLVVEAEARGHRIGAHCFEHRSHFELSEEQIDQDTVRLLAALEEIGVARPELWRPPFGHVHRPATHAVARRHDLRVVTWTVETCDWQRRSAAELMREIADGVRPGAVLRADSVVLLHDALGPRAAELVGLLSAEVRRRGWSLTQLRADVVTPEIPPMDCGCWPLADPDDIPLRQIRRVIGRALARVGLG